jgi:hypothetical protein
MSTQHTPAEQRRWDTLHGVARLIDAYLAEPEPEPLPHCRCGEPITDEDYRLGTVAEVADASGAHILIHYDSCLRPGDQLA